MKWGPYGSRIKAVMQDTCQILKQHPDLNLEKLVVDQMPEELRKLLLQLYMLCQGYVGKKNLCA